MRTLKHRMRGKDVRNWQSILNHLGIYHLAEDGIFGKKTEAATKDFQQKASLLVDGLVGEQTMKAAEGILVHLPSSSPNTNARNNNKYQEIIPAHYTPNARTKTQNKCNGVVFHHSCGSYEGSVSWCLDPKAAVSYHCMINLDGERTILAPDNYIAWHAGKSSFRNREWCNQYMLGLSFSGNTYDRDLTEAEIGSMLEWLTPRWKKYHWSLDWMVSHREVAPDRKDDPSPAAMKQILIAIGNHLLVR